MVVMRLKVEAIARKRTELPITNILALRRLIFPVMSSRFLVRRFFASISRSMIRLIPIAAERAVAIAAITRTTCQTLSSNFRLRIAIVAKTKGRAKIVCENLTKLLNVTIVFMGNRQKNIWFCCATNKGYTIYFFCFFCPLLIPHDSDEKAFKKLTYKYLTFENISELDALLFPGITVLRIFQKIF